MKTFFFLEKNYLLQPASTEFKSGDGICVKAQVKIDFIFPF